MDFIAFDVETANPNMSSICQLGIVGFQDGAIVQEWEWLINPHTYFDEFNIEIHGITPYKVKGNPSWSDLYPQIADIFKGNLIVSHTPFDRVAFNRACLKHKLECVSCAWLDSARVVRRAWTQYAWSGYGLGNVTRDLGISYTAHNAREDARAAGEVLVHAIQHTGYSIGDWLERVNWRIGATDASSYHQSIVHDGDPDGSLNGEVVVFTGVLSMSRAQAAELAAKAGCDVSLSVTTKTTMLVVGAQDMDVLAGYTKSSKHRKAESLISKGQAIRILGENDFMAMVDA